MALGPRQGSVAGHIANQQRAAAGGAPESCDGVVGGRIEGGARSGQGRDGS